MPKNDTPTLDRPYEKLMINGKTALSNQELLSIILQSGTKGQSSLDLANHLLSDLVVPNNLAKLLELDVYDLKNYKGIGIAKAARIVAAMELGRRALTTNQLANEQSFNSPKTIFNYVRDSANAQEEVLTMLLLDCQQHLLKRILMAKGSLTEINFDMRKIARLAIRYDAKNVVLIHNHPSGNLEPSFADLEATKSLVKYLRQMDINLLDHLVINQVNYLSIRAKRTELFE